MFLQSLFSCEIERALFICKTLEEDTLNSTIEGIDPKNPYKEKRLFITNERF